MNLPTQAQASGTLSINSGRHGRYTEVVVNDGRYYYDQGIFYTGGPGNYVVIEAPDGAVVYNIPRGYQRIQIDGLLYYRYRDIYYRPEGRKYRVVHVDHSRQHQDNRRGYERRKDNRNDNRRN